MLHPAYFITATGTGIGKTLATSLLLRQLRARQIEASALKPVITGFNRAETDRCDSGILLSAMGKEVSDAALDHLSPWRFPAPVSPHLAARNQPLSCRQLSDYCHRNLHGITLIEGVGGVMAPINERETVREWIELLGFPVILVTGTYLGTFSHTLTALESLNSKGIVPASILVSASDDHAETLQETAASLRQFTGDRIRILTLPRLPLDRILCKIDNNILNHLPDLTQLLT